MADTGHTALTTALKTALNNLGANQSAIKQAAAEIYSTPAPPAGAPTPNTGPSPAGGTT